MYPRISIAIICLLITANLKAQYTINDTFADPSECVYMTRDAFIIWWDKDFDYTAEVDILLDQIIGYRTECLNELNMMDPPGIIDGYYQNIYLHGDGGYFDQYGWGNGVGTDSNGYPFYTMPYGLFNDIVTVAHEIFHLYQYNSNSPGFGYFGDSQWFIEASANWYGARQDFTAERAFIEAESLVRLPHVPFWLSYDNFPTTYPQNWQRYVHQYALALHLFYLTEVVGVSPNVISEGFYMGVTEMPQEYLYNELGSEDYRDHFIEWAARMTNDFDFITEIQKAANEQEWLTYADPADENEYTETFDENGSNGWYQPSTETVTNAWSFNTYKIDNSSTTAYTFELDGDTNGTYGTAAYFQGKVLVRNASGIVTFHDLIMMDDTNGYLVLNVDSNDSEIFFIVASMPEYFQDPNPDFQLFPYQMRISNGVLGSADFTTSNFVRAYPNPVKSLLQLAFHGKEHQIDIELYSLLGQRLLKRTFYDLSEMQIDFSELSSGVYFLDVITENKSQTLKMVKE